jgi:hypothetical protein
MVNLCVIFSHHSRQTARSSGSLGSLRAPGPSALSLSTHRPRHRDENPVTANPLESALTNRDARKSFRIRFYKNGRVSPTFSRQIRNSPLVTNHSPLLAPFLFKSLRTLPFYVCYKSFICRSYENCRGVGVFFPFWNSTFAVTWSQPSFGNFGYNRFSGALRRARP